MDFDFARWSVYNNPVKLNGLPLLEFVPHSHEIALNGKDIIEVLPLLKRLEIMSSFLGIDILSGGTNFASTPRRPIPRMGAMADIMEDRGRLPRFVNHPMEFPREYKNDHEYYVIFLLSREKYIYAILYRMGILSDPAEDIF